MMNKEQIAILTDNYYEGAIQAFENQELTKKDLEPLAWAGDLDAALILLLGEYSCKRRFWTEDYEDENTHEVVQVERYDTLDELLVESLPEERQRLFEQVVRPRIPEMDNERLQTLWSVFSRASEIVEEFCRELARRGDPEAIEAIGILDESRG